MAAPVINVVTVIAATESLVVHVTATVKQSVPAIPVATVAAAMEFLVIHVAAMAKPFAKTNRGLISS